MNHVSLRRPASILGLFCLVALPAFATSGEAPELAIASFTLPNGLNVILHEDHTLPVVAVNVWYHVGSKNEKPGRTGFAHLFEHMMFQGSEHHDTDYFLPLQKVGGRVNGSTTEDRTNYWENVPSDQLELALWLESDRMGWLLPSMTQERLDNQRDVVKNEKRQGENRPYAVVRELRQQLMYPEGHPYRWTVIGSMDDLSAASLDDVKDFFRLYYAPNNASLCIAGDFDPTQARALVEKYFGPIPPGQPVQRLEDWQPRLDGERRAVAEDRVELARLSLTWHSPGYFQPGEAELDLLATILADGKNSRLYRTLVHDRELAQDVRAYQSSNEMSGMFSIQVTARPGVSLDTIEAAVDAELDRVRDKGVTKDEVALAQATYETQFVRRLQREGGFGGIADLLNEYATFAGTPDDLAQDMARYRSVTPDAVRDFARRYLPPHDRVVIDVVPQGTLAAPDDAADRTQLPGSGGPLAFTPPAIETTTLANGLQVCLVHRTGLPLVGVSLAVRTGWAADPADRPGTAAMTANLLDEGTREHDAVGLENAARALGAEIRTHSTFDGTFVSTDLLRSHLDDGLALIGEMVREPVFPDDEFARQRKLALGRIKQASQRPTSVGMALLQEKIFGAGHPYAQPMSGTGTPEGLNALTRNDIAQFHAAHFVSNNAALCITGDLTLSEAKAAAERVFGDWARGTVAPVTVPAPRPDRSARIFLVDRPGAEQSAIVGGYPGISAGDPDELPLEVLNTALGGQFASRINMNLREDKGYTYGARTMVMTSHDGGAIGVSTQVQTPSTAASITEILKEFADICGPRPLQGDELADCENQLVMGFPQNFETYQGICRQMGNLLTSGLPLDDWQAYDARVRACTAQDMRRLAAQYIRPDDLVFVIVGDRAKIEDDLRALNVGEVTVVSPPEGGA